MSLYSGQKFLHENYIKTERVQTSKPRATEDSFLRELWEVVPETDLFLTNYCSNIKRFFEKINLPIYEKNHILRNM